MLNAVADIPGEEWSVEVLLEAGEEDVLGQLPPVGLALEQTEGGTLLRCSTWNLGWIARVLAGFDCSFIVRRPAELREALQSALMRYPSSPSVPRGRNRRRKRQRPEVDARTRS